MFCQVFNCVQRLRSGGAVFSHKHGRGLHHAHQAAGALNDVKPVCIANRPQRLDRVAHAQVVGGLILRLLGAGCGQVGQCNRQPLQMRRAVGGRLAIRARISTLICPARLNPPITAGVQPQRHLRQKNATHTALVEQRQQLVKLGQGVGVNLVANQVGHLSGGLVGCHALGQATQVFHQHHPQRGGQCPNFP